ncbi:MAG: hypothetical protein ACI870_000598, partial [Crocinitomicaceae bacterium]
DKGDIITAYVEFIAKNTYSIFGSSEYF